MAVLSSALTLWLCINAPPSPEANERLELLEQLTNELEPTPEARDGLARAIAATEAQGVEVAHTVELREALGRARLGLVWALLIAGEDEAAAAAMDEAIRSSMGYPLEAGTFGTQVLALFEARMQALREAGVASIAAECERCELIINEHRSPRPSERLPLGVYRVWVVATDGRFEPAYFEIELDEAGVDATVPIPSFAALPDYAAPAPSLPEPPCRLCKGPAMGPLGFAGSVTIAGGVASVIGGSLLSAFGGYVIALDEQIMETSDDTLAVDTDPNPQALGNGMAIAGAVSIGVGVIALIVDRELQRKQDPRQALRLSPTPTGVSLQGSF